MQFHLTVEVKDETWAAHEAHCESETEDPTCGVCRMVKSLERIGTEVGAEVTSLEF